MRTYCITRGTLLKSSGVRAWFLNGKEILKRGDIYIYTHIAGSFCSTVETNTHCKANTPIKKLKKNLC